MLKNLLQTEGRLPAVDANQIDLSVGSLCCHQLINLSETQNSNVSNHIIAIYAVSSGRTRRSRIVDEDMKMYEATRVRMANTLIYLQFTL